MIDVKNGDYSTINEAIRVRHPILSLLQPKHELLGYYEFENGEGRIAARRHESFCRRFPKDYRNPSFLEAMRGYAICLDLAISRIAVGLDEGFGTKINLP